MHDEIYMARALELARRGRFTTTPNPNVGCVIVSKGKIVGEGYHICAGESHAEVHALRMAGELARGATAYVTLEPCSHHGRTPPCGDALIVAGIKRVVAAMQDPNPAVAGCSLYHLQQAGIEVSHGLMMEEAEALNRGFLKRMRLGFPWIQLKIGASLDGCTAMASGESQWITSTESRRDVQRLRAQSSAILSTSKTVLADNPSLTVRYNELDSETKKFYPEDRLRQPVRIIVDSQNQITPQHRLIEQPGETWLARIKCNEQQQWPKNVTQFTVPQYKGKLDIVSMILLLGKKQINSVCVEAGAQFTGAMLQAGIVDELILYLAPRLLGDTGRNLCQLPSLRQLADAPAFAFSDVRQVGPDLRLTMIPL